MISLPSPASVPPIKPLTLLLAIVMPDRLGGSAPLEHMPIRLPWMSVPLAPRSTITPRVLPEIVLAEPAAVPPAQFAALIKTDMAKWAKLIRDAKIKLGTGD